MTLYDKIKAVYPELQDIEFMPVIGAVNIRDDLDGRGEYIAKWEHPTYPRPTTQQLNAQG